MGVFKLGKMTLSSLFSKPETVCYPQEKKQAPAGLKGTVVTNEQDCILCGSCQRACPTNAIEVNRKERKWIIDPFACIQCSSCVRACPKKCLEMTTLRPAPAKEKSVKVHTIPAQS